MRLTEPTLDERTPIERLRDKYIHRASVETERAIKRNQMCDAAVEKADADEDRDIDREMMR